MPIDPDRRLAFVHVQKAAGVSIVHALDRAGVRFSYTGRGLADLFPHGPHGEAIRARFKELVPTTNEAAFPHQHLPAAILRDLVGAEVWADYFSFAFVRNPWDRFVSLYHYLRDRYADPAFSGKQPRMAELFRRAPDFDTYARIYEQDRRDQASMVRDYDGSVLVNFVGRYERLAEDLARVGAATGIDLTVPHLNASDHGPYRDYYTARTRAKIAELYATDIALFGYTF
jgi:hypothetical protein